MEKEIKVEVIKLFNYYSWNCYYSSVGNSQFKLVDIDFVKKFILDSEKRNTPILRACDAPRDTQDSHLAFSEDFWRHSDVNENKYYCKNVRTADELLNGLLSEGKEIARCYGVCYFNGRESWWHCKECQTLKLSEHTGYKVNGKVFVPML